MTAGEWAKLTRRERWIASTILFVLGGLGLAGAMAAMCVFALGELTGHALTDTAVLGFVALGSLTGIYNAMHLLEGPVCRFCHQPLKETEFRCPRCASLVNEPDGQDEPRDHGRDDYAR